MGCIERQLVNVCLALLGLALFLMWGSYPWTCEEIDVNGHVIVITGAGSGIAAELAAEYCSRGANVLLASSDEEGLARTARDCFQAGASRYSVAQMVFDELDPNDENELLLKALSRFGRINTLVIAHAAWNESLLLDYRDSFTRDFEHLLRVNTIGPARLALRSLPYLHSSSIL